MTFAREAAFAERAETWRNRLWRETTAVLAASGPQEYALTLSELPMLNATKFAMDRRDAFLRLLIADLAVRWFRHTEGRLPNSLDELCPRYLSAVPRDPFGDGSLVYRRVGGDFLLYSVGHDRHDDGGVFGAMADLFRNGIDYDLDIGVRPQTPARPPSTAPANGGS